MFTTYNFRENEFCYFPLVILMLLWRRWLHYNRYVSCYKKVLFVKTDGGEDAFDNGKTCINLCVKTYVIIINIGAKMELTLTIALRKYCELLEKHGGRDKVVRICGYICTLISDLPVISVIFKLFPISVDSFYYKGSKRWTTESKV